MLEETSLTDNQIMNSLDQKSLLKLYARYVSKPKADFFRSVGLGIIQGSRAGVHLRSLEGPRKNKPRLNLIDCRTSGGVFNLGHQHPVIMQAVKDAINAGYDIGDHHLISEQRALLARDLALLLPRDISKTQFSVGGGEAIDLAIKLAMASTKKLKIVSARTGYHGVTGFALGAGSIRFKAPFYWSPKNYFNIEFGNIDVLKKTLDEDTAAVIFETIPATGGILIPPEGYFAEVRELCDQLGIIMIQDEVQTGLGRTGSLWGIYGGLYPNEKIVPDIMVLAKGLSGGFYPIATTSYKPFLGEVFKDDPFLHISTTGGSEIGCYVARQVLHLQSESSFLDHVRNMGRLMMRELKILQENFSHFIKEVRGRGLMIGIEFHNEQMGVGFTLKMIQNGIFADYCGNDEKTVKLMPPLIISRNEVLEVIRRLKLALRSISA